MRATDAQVKKLRAEMKEHGVIAVAAARAGMHRNTARRYLKTEKLPSELSRPRDWRTRPDPFAEVWSEVVEMLESEPGFEAKTIFEELKRRHPGDFQEGQLRSLQRKVKVWRAEHGPEKELFFPQEHVPGESAQTDFTWMKNLGITIQGEPYPHMLCHTSLPYSNWSWGTPCQSESMVALKKGVQNNFSKLGYLPEYHQTDNSSAATHDLQKGKRGFNKDYVELMEHMGMKPRTIGVGKKEQNGDIEAQNGALKRFIEQQLMLRSFRDFESEDRYLAWLHRVFEKRNRSRKLRLETETRVMKPYKAVRLPDFSEHDIRIGESGTFRLKGVPYSLPSRLKYEKVRVRLFDDCLEIYYAQRLQFSLERRHGKGACNIDYRHLIDPMLRKPGAFRRYRYRDALYPTQVFRDAHDRLDEELPQRQADIEYLRILHLAAQTCETEVEAQLIELAAKGQAPTALLVKSLVKTEEPEAPELPVPPVSLDAYDRLLEGQGGLQA